VDHTHSHTPKPPCRLQVGTSGYSYTEWIDAGFYPPGTRTGNMLACYAETFNTTELNYTWYQMPRSRAIERMRRKVPANFTFAAKLTRTLTHEIDTNTWRMQVAQYRDGIAPLVQSRQLAAILLQFPKSFPRTMQNRKYLALLLDELAGLPAAVEFRHASWATDRVFAELERRKITLVAVDEPNLPGLFPCLDVVTSPNLFYIRFHGRNTKGWRCGNMQKQFDYHYNDAELREWSDVYIKTMADNARSGIIFFNNHVRAQAPDNAVHLTRILTEQGLI